MKYIVPQELKSESKLWKSLYITDLFITIGYVLVLNIFSVFVPDELSIAYFIFNLIVAFILTRKSPYNPKKRIYQTIYYFLLKEKYIYKPIAIKRKDDIHVI